MTKISEETAVSIARNTAEENGWAWVEPVDVAWRSDWRGKRGKWEITTNARGLGAKARVIVRDDGTILEKGYIPR